MKVVGDHRVAIFAKERIEACVELFYDYGYAPDEAHFLDLKLDHFARAQGAEGLLSVHRASKPKQVSLITCITIIIEKLYTSFNTLFCKYANTMITRHFQHLHVSKKSETL